MRWASRFTLGFATGILFLACFAQLAKAAYPPEPGWDSQAHMAPTGTLCLQHGNSTFIGPAITAAAAGWNATDLTVVARASCTGFVRQAQVRFAAYYNPATKNGYVTECAMFYSGGWEWVQMRGVWTYRAIAPVVKVNYTSLAMKQCWNTLANKTGIIEHETGHYLGMSHAVGITVMTAGMSRYKIATYYDRVRINGRY